MNQLAEWLGVSRAALYKSTHRFERYGRLTQKVVGFVDGERKINKKIGGVKLHVSFCRDYPQIKIGRDQFLRILREQGRLLRKKRRYKKKESHDYAGRKDLAHQLAVAGPGHLWVHDDTEVNTRDGKAHLALSTDYYSSKVVGYNWSKRANSVHVRGALEMALADYIPGPVKLIHHSDNGSIYASKAYQVLLGEHIQASWSPPGRPDRNPKAERINLIFKQEYLCDAAHKTFEELARELPSYISHYNERRPHMSCNNGYPSEVHELAYEPKKLWKQRPRSYPVTSRQNEPTKTNGSA
tara:strand:+ start:578 stop:1468 length:891 start_codon:yes stop_codon:yes gene_type:complete